MKMAHRRLLIIINNLLGEIIKTQSDIMDEETYTKWLRTEIGLTDDEINYLKAKNCFPSYPRN